MIKGIDVRFFTYCIMDIGTDIAEITESQFLALDGEITYERHTVFDNGGRQVCLTVNPLDWPEIDDLEVIE